MSIALLYLAALNIFDGAVTYIGLENSVIQELNQLMNTLYEIHPWLFLAFKTALSIILIILIATKVYPKTKIIQYSVSLASILYTAVCGIHLYWLSHHI